MLTKLRFILTRRDKVLFLYLILFSIFISIIEVIGISAIMPFISVSMNYDLIHSNKYFSFIYNFISFKNDIDFVIAFGIILILFYISRSGITIFYQYMISKFAQGRYHLIVYRLFENYMGMPYKDFVKKNSSTLTKSIITEANQLVQLMTSILLIMSEVFILVFIYIVILVVNFKLTLIVTVFLVINAALMIKVISNKIKIQGEIRADVQELFYEIINKSFGNFKLIKLQVNDKSVINEFAYASKNYVKANIIAQTLREVPKLFLEAVAFSLIILIILYLLITLQDNTTSILSMLSIYVLALYRLMPSVSKILSHYNNILYYMKSLDIIHNDLMYDSEDLGNKDIEFKKSIEIKNLNFEYEENKLVLKNINLKIDKGSKVGFIGESGSGKSTLVDIIIGLYKYKSGSILSNNTILDDSNIKAWRSKIGYIPQSVYLFDGTVGENVAFGSTYNVKKIDDVLKRAKIYDFLNTKEGKNTLVGEGGIMLSGGQKQRIAIARALYIDPEILVLDEATSALDNNTEQEIMNEIYDISNDKTLIIIAHRLSTLDRCEKIYRLKNGEMIND